MLVEGGGEVSSSFFFAADGPCGGVDVDADAETAAAVLRTGTRRGNMLLLMLMLLMMKEEEEYV
jgi:hypothetical protein